MTTSWRKFQVLNALITVMEATDALTVRPPRRARTPEFITLNVRLAYVGMPPSAIAGEGTSTSPRRRRHRPYRFANGRRWPGMNWSASRLLGELPNMPAVLYIARPEAACAR